MPPLSRGFLRPGSGRSLLLPSRSTCYRRASTRNPLFKVSEEVRDALKTGKPVVALESTIYTHGFPYPENVALSSQLESLVRVNGGVPATVGILNGVARVGMAAEELIELVSTAGSKDTWKISRRDLGFIGGLGLTGRKLNGGTTIAGTMILAHLAGIKIFATGGLGGVHRGAENSMDISADLTELGRTPVTVISSGCKSFLDIPRTLEYLETQGVGVGTFADGREGSVDFPAFFSRDSGVPSPKVIIDEAEAAAIVYVQHKYGLQSGLLFANPVPESAGLSKQEMDVIIEKALQEGDSQGIRGSENTPYILKRIREISGGRSIGANRALIEANVIRGTKVAVELAKLELRDEGVLERLSSRSVEISPKPSTSQSIVREAGDLQIDGGAYQTQESVPQTQEPKPQPIDILVAGSLALDLMCDYQPLDGFSGPESPALHTSNPARVSQSVGGVGHNVALAAHYSGASVALVTSVADDVIGAALIEKVFQSGMSTTSIQKLKANETNRTAQYIAVNDRKKDLVMAMADMSILASPELNSLDYWTSVISSRKPKWLVVDANWSSAILSNIIKAAKTYRIPVAFEPVSTQKAARLLQKTAKTITSENVVPNNVVSLATPNALELKSMYDSAREASLFESEHWWMAIHRLGMSSGGSRDRLVSITSSEMVDQGIPQQSIQLLPYIPNIVTKLGAKGCLVTSLLPAGDPRLHEPESAPFILARGIMEESPIGGVYMRLFPAAEDVKQEDIMSVNGVGDTMLGALMAGLVAGRRRIEEVVPLAQKAAVLTLKSDQGVSPEVKGMREILSLRE